MFYTRSFISTALVSATILVAPAALAHTNSIGYENAGAGAVTFWYGSWHANTNFTEGSLNVTGPNSYNVTQTFTQVVQVKPGGLIDGTTNFYSNGTALVGTPGQNGTYSWQGATLSNLTPGTYVFTYIPIQNPTATWQPEDNIILSSSVFLSQSIVGGALQPNAGAGASSAAGVLDEIAGNSPTGDIADIIDSLTNMTSDEQKAALDRIAPQTSQAVGTASMQAISGALDSVSVRLDSIRSEGYRTASADILSRGGEIQIASAGDLTPILSGTGKRNSFWTKAFGAYSKQGLDDGFNGYKAKTGGMAFGADTLLDSDWVVGAAATYAATQVNMSNYRNGDYANVDSYQATLYTSRDFGKWYLEAMAAGAYQTFDTARDTGFGVASGNFDGWNFATRATIGKPIPVSRKTKITPSVGLEYNHLRQSSYREQEAGPLNLSVQDESANRLRSVVQAKVTTELLHDGYKFVPGAHIGWRHEFMNEGIDSTATFNGGGSSFTTQGQKTQRDTLNLGVSLSASQTQDFTLTMQADSELADKYTGYSGQLVAQWRF